MRYALLLISLLVTMTAYADDTSSIDSIVNAYYEVVSGPEGFIYDADRDTNIHADGALITKVFPDGRFQRHDLSAEQAMISVPYDKLSLNLKLIDVLSGTGTLRMCGVNLRCEPLLRQSLTAADSTVFPSTLKMIGGGSHPGRRNTKIRLSTFKSACGGEADGSRTQSSSLML